MSEFTGRRVLVLGLGATGFAAARVLAGLGASVVVSESGEGDAVRQRAASLRDEGIEVRLGEVRIEHPDADLAVVSPGIPPSSEAVAAVEEAGIPVVAEIEIAYRLARCDLLAVTGTNGKTTTTSLLAAMLAESGIESAAAGNIGLPLIEAVGRVGEGGAIAAEVSSFQLATIERFRPRVAVLLNVAEDHTDWHGSFDSYARDKARIIENQTSDDIFIPNADDRVAMSISQRAPGRVIPFSGTHRPDGGSGFEEGRLMWRGEAILDAVDIPIPGLPGREDVAAAATAVLEYGVSPAAVARAVKGFRSAPHRLEVVAQAGGITYIDDSKATNPHATLSAVRDLTDVVLIAGGRAKGVDLSVLRGTVPPVIAVVALGEATEEIERAFAGKIPVTAVRDMDTAVAAAHAQATPGGSVLLSPACASLDMFENYAQRGEAFARAVGALLGLGPSRATDDRDRARDVKGGAYGDA